MIHSCSSVERELIESLENESAEMKNKKTFQFYVTN